MAISVTNIKPKIGSIVHVEKSALRWGLPIEAAVVDLGIWLRRRAQAPP